MYTAIHLRKLEDNISYIHQKQLYQLLSYYEFLLFYLEVAHHPY